MREFSDVPRPPEQLEQSSVPCDLSKTCDVCATPGACKRINVYRYVEKRGGKLSNTQCNCSTGSLDNLEAQSVPSGMLHSGSETDISSSDEFCECCSCGCENQR